MSLSLLLNVTGLVVLGLGGHVDQSAAGALVEVGLAETFIPRINQVLPWVLTLLLG